MAKPEKKPRRDKAAKQAEKAARAAEAKEAKAKRGLPLSLSAALTTLVKRHPRGVEKNAVTLAIPRIPTGIFKFDLALGGGPAAGRVLLLPGAKASGKTTTALRIVAQFQRMCARCWVEDPECRCAAGPRKPMTVWEDVENVFDPAWAVMCGVDVSEGRFLLIRPESAEMAVDFVELIRANEVGLMVVDSIAFLTPTEEIDKSALEGTRPKRALLANSLVRKSVMAMSMMQNRGTIQTMVLLNQLYDTLTQYKGHTVQVEPGGKGQTFAASVVARMNRVEYHYEKGSEDKPDRRTPAIAAVNGFDVRFSKIAPPGMIGEYRMFLRNVDGWRATEVDDAEDVMSEAFRRGVLRSAGGEKIRFPVGIEAETVEFPTRAALAASWRTDDAEFRRAKRRVIDAAYAKV